MPGGPLDLGKFLPVRILVLVSFGLQVVLFVCAGVRRHEATGVWRLRRLLLWQAYIMADYMAIYALGHLSLRSKAHDHQLDAFWAPFLLLHLGGPDNITAYALQDNQLWLRHLQTLVLQVGGAAYVIYKNRAGSVAPKLIFAVGLVKYVERTWALKCGNLDSIRISVKTQPPAMHKHSHRQDEVPSSKKNEDQFDEESHLRRAHSLFHICKRAMVDCSVFVKDPDGRQDTRKMMAGKVELWRLMETELSLMYDILYTKAAVIHTWHGYCIRLISPIATFVSLVLFRLSGNDKDDGRRRADVIITYVLFVGALFMETTSLLNALVSSWAFAFLSTTRWRRFRYEALCSERWDRLRRKVVSLHHFVMGEGSRYESRRWSGNMGQYNMMHFCTRPDTPMTSPLLGRLAKAVRLMETWNKKHYSGTVNISDYPLIRERIAGRMGQLYKDVGLNSLGMLRKKWGEEPLARRGLYRGFLQKSLGVEFQEGIIIWHIGTDVFLSKSERAKAEAASPRPLGLVKAIKVLSNYMMFLLVERPYMLPGNAQSRLYQRTNENLGDLRKRSTLGRRRKMSICAMVKSMFRLRDGPGSTSSRPSDGEELAKHLYREHVNGSTKFTHECPRLTYAARLAQELLEMEKHKLDDSLQLVLEVWMDLLVYAGNKCSKESHAKKLNDGGELTTIIWLMAEHLHQLSVEEDSYQGLLREDGV
ncbi:unnamed protein product [Triticum turgidum subsp. durum]|uniref:DUF4220 domain-containing protein n=1 Tax=Triticum turgidum subsp. durum TaxID=4567 RepID=A0A9R1PEW6_TRITD|nr:unnamed protein product [Triticum turgidum subsp. durum]